MLEQSELVPVVPSLDDLAAADSDDRSPENLESGGTARFRVFLTEAMGDGIRCEEFVDCGFPSLIPDLVKPPLNQNFEIGKWNLSWRALDVITERRIRRVGRAISAHPG